MTDNKKTKYRYIDLEEGLIIMGYGLTKEKALLLMNRYTRKNWGDRMTDSENDLMPIYELTTTEKDYGEEELSWKDEPPTQNARVLGYVFKC